MPRMDFFAHQEIARQHTLRLVLLLLAAVVGVIAATDLLVTQGLALIYDKRDLPWLYHQVLDGTILITILISALWRLFQLRGGGDAVAEMVGARQMMRHAESLEERRLLNVVDEMSIASGVAVPSVWVMDNEQSINAFAAGYSPNQAVIVVTRGMLAQLSRDELQGVIGHEFSHILNGDMLLNVRLIGILAGIVVLGRAGLLVIGFVMAIPSTLMGAMSFIGFKINDWFSDRLHGWRIVIWLPVFFIVSSPLLLLVLGLLYAMAMGDYLGAKPLMFLGALIFTVGYIGVFFGRLIRAAVSRQREFLADAASVQFTRNPDGLVSALEKIRRSEGSVINNAYAGEMSHMFFSQAISPMLFKNWFATHPSIDERLESITGRKPEALKKSPDAAPVAPTDAWSVAEAAASDFAAATPQGRIDSDVARTLLAQVGSATPQHMQQAARLLAAMPDSLRQSLHHAEGARAAVYAYLISPDANIRAIQIRALTAAGDGAATKNIDDLIKTLHELGRAARLPVLALATPALRQMDQSAREVFLIAVDQLVEAGHTVALDEFVIRTILKWQLSAKASRAERVRYRDIKSVRADVLSLLATIARAGSSERAKQKSAFARGAARLGLAHEMPTGTMLAADAMSASLGRLRQLAPLEKPALLLACVDTALVDGKLPVVEAELLRAIGMAIDCPLPPMLETYSVV